MAELVRVGDRESFEQILDTETFDVIISDFHLPSFTGLEALAIAKEKCHGHAVHPCFRHDWRTGGD